MDMLTYYEDLYNSLVNCSIRIENKLLDGNPISLEESEYRLKLIALCGEIYKNYRNFDFDSVSVLESDSDTYGNDAIPADSDFYNKAPNKKSHPKDMKSRILRRVKSDDAGDVSDTYGNESIPDADEDYNKTNKKKMHPKDMKNWRTRLSADDGGDMDVTDAGDDYGNDMISIDDDYGNDGIFPDDELYSLPPNKKLTPQQMVDDLKNTDVSPEFIKYIDPEVPFVRDDLNNWENLLK